MNTYLGAAQDLFPTDIDPELVAATSIVYLEGYLGIRRMPNRRS